MSRGRWGRWSTGFFAAACVLIALTTETIHGHFLATSPYTPTEDYRWLWLVSYGLLTSFVAYSLGIPDHLRSYRRAALYATAAALITAGITSLAQFAVGETQLPRFVVLASAIVLVPVVLAAHSVGRSLHGRLDQERVVVVAVPHEVALLRNDVERDAERSLVISRIIDPDSLKEMGGETDLAQAFRSASGTLLVLGRRAQHDDRAIWAASVLHESGVRVRTLAQFYESWLAKVPVQDLERLSLMIDIGDVHVSLYSRVKRLADITMAVILLPVLAVCTVFVLIGNMFGNRGPLIYTQERVGQGGRLFRIHKFRSMTPQTSHSDWTLDDDPRVTQFGRFLRTTHIDELPQIINVLRGELSTVGPRPEQVRYVEELAKEIPFYTNRHLVRPGITGWAQVRYGYGNTMQDALEKLQYDFYYLRNQSLWLDARCIVRTIRSTAEGPQTHLADRPAVLDLRPANMPATGDLTP